MADQMRNEVEHLRLDMHDLAFTAKLLPVEVEFARGETEPHRGSLQAVSCRAA
jgi:hypothetical protein